MRILVFSPYYPPHIGGLENHSAEFNSQLSRLGYEIIVATPRIPETAIEKEVLVNNVKVYRFPAFEIIPNYPIPKFWSLKFWKLINYLYHQDYDFIISRTRFFITSPMALVFSKFKKIKWMHIEHGSDYVEVNSRLSTTIARVYDNLIGRMVFKQSDINVSISKAVNKFVQTFDTRPSPIIYRGLNYGEIDSIEPDYNFKRRYQGKTILAFVGRLYKWKGVRNTILGLKLLPDSINRKLIYMVIGDGEDFEGLKKIGADNVIFTGGLEWKKAIALLKVSDIYIHSSYSGGGLSTSLLEAIYCGCRIVATPGEGAEEIIDNKIGILINESNPDSIISGVQKTLGNIKKGSTNSYSRKFIKTNFSWQISINKYDKLLKSLK